MTIAVGSVRGVELIWQTLRGKPNPQAAGLDYRIVAIGALLPDAIDKPLAVFGPDAFSDGRTIGHTLLVTAAIIAAGAVLSRRGEMQMLSLGLGSLTHLFADTVVVYPREFFWPAFGTSFPHSPGVNGWYLLAVDSVLVATGLAAFARSDKVRTWWRRFVRTGAVTSDEG